MRHKHVMLIHNPDYNPDWEAIHDFHHDQRARLQREINALMESYSSTESGKLKRLEKERSFHNATCLRCLDTYQHKTVQDFVKWSLENSLQLSEIFKDECASHICFDHCQSIEQAKIIISQLIALYRKKAFLDGKSSGGKYCPAGRPDDDLDIFENTGSNNIISLWTDFRTQSNFGPFDIHEYIVLTSVDRHKDVIHVCFYADEDESRKAGMIMGRIGQLAFQFIQNDLGPDFDEFAKSQVKKQTGLPLPGFLHPKHKSFPAYRFYTHTVMAGTLPREDFIEHIFDYGREDSCSPGSRAYGCFRRTKMQPYRSMPRYLKDAVQEHIGFDGICLCE